MALSTTLLIWNSRREAENSARSSLSAAAVALRLPLQKNADLDQIKQLLTLHNARASRGAWASEVEAWLLSPAGKVKWKTGPFLPPRRGPRRDDGEFGRGDGDGPPPDGQFGGEGFEGRPPQQGDGQGGPPPEGGGPHDGWSGPPPQWMRFAVPPRQDGGNWRSIEVRRGADTLVLGVPWFRNSRALRSQALTLLFLGLLSSAAAAVGAWFLVGKVLSPIEKLALQANGLAQTDAFDGRLISTSSDAEMRHLTTTLNEMLVGLGEAARSKERFHAAASHELRTPLQALSGHLQVALSRIRGAEEYRVALEEAARQTERLSSLTRDLLMLNQLQMATSRPPHEAVDVTEIVAQSIDRHTPMLDSRHIEISEVLRECEIEAAPSHIEMLVRNLIENAVKYARDAGRIEVTLQNLELLVWNETEIESKNSDLESLFEPFYRPDASRNSATGGNGLGLSICRAICEANGWIISLLSESRGGKHGVCARIHFVTYDPENLNP